MKEQSLYKRNASGAPIVWCIESLNNVICISHGIVGKKLHNEVIPYTMSTLETEIKSRINSKRKEGYKYISELKDSAPEIIDDSSLLSYLNAYLPKYNTTDSGLILPMLAKTLENNKPFDKFGYMLGQWKINGLRCIVGIERVAGDLFKEFKVTYQSREGTKWELPDMDDYILTALDKEMISMMVEEGIHLDGELYIPGLTVNEINSAVKNPQSPWHHNLQYWIYDLCDSDIVAGNRKDLIYKHFYKYISKITNKEQHYSNEEKIVVLPTVDISSFQSAVLSRDYFINLGFEGLILRNPNAEYMFGKRSVNGMYKFKKKDDGYFKILDIKLDKRNLPIFTVQNDINDEAFEVTLNASQELQLYYHTIMDKVIGKLMLVEYRERSGVKQVPFHAKGIRIID